MTQATSTPIKAQNQPWFLQLWFYVLVAMAVGVALGQFYPSLGAKMQPLGDAFIKAIRVVIAPIIFCSVVHGIASMANMAKVGRVALKALIYFEVLTTVALIIGLVAVNVFRPGVGMNVDLSHIDTSSLTPYLTQTHKQTTEEFLLNIIPNTFVGAFAEGNVLQVLYVAVLCGFALSWLGEKAKPLTTLIDVATEMLFRIVAIVMWAAPIGAFGAIAFTVGKFGSGSLLSLGQLLISFYLTCLIFVFGVLWPIAHWCGFSLPKLIRYIWEELLIVFATTSSETVLPRMIAKMQAAGCEQSVVGLVIPTGYSFNLDGTCLYLATAAVFLAQATNTPLTIEHQIGLLLVLLLASKGAAGVAGAAFVVLAATLASVGTIPVESVALILGIHRLMSEGLTPTNLVGNAVATIVVAKWEGALDEDKLHRVLDRKA
ncbi:C4-dicarboxylate transporter DctA [Rhodoplanes sp. Z2-YC6860]|uniref:C4-dicarboxylate transporter DctA n=1 Tax=Rhodoplanes sp. Z2-YC6860 TaxID=674703 RepID=UPI00078ECBD9|nr:C4-dicarboxylate transporter DctA [Rhodoplanes sp. Z2-YC6860]AMN42655.1 C4-dicarboxylate transporter [Rhodoplanes sp. Z2-YC6860]